MGQAGGAGGLARGGGCAGVMGTSGTCPKSLKHVRVKNAHVGKCWHKERRYGQRERDYGQRTTSVGRELFSLGKNICIIKSGLCSTVLNLAVAMVLLCR